MLLPPATVVVEMPTMFFKHDVIMFTLDGAVEEILPSALAKIDIIMSVRLNRMRSDAPLGNICDWYVSF